MCEQGEEAGADFAFTSADEPPFAEVVQLDAFPPQPTDLTVKGIERKHGVGDAVSDSRHGESQCRLDDFKGFGIFKFDISHFFFFRPRERAAKEADPTSPKPPKAACCKMLPFNVVKLVAGSRIELETSGL